MEIDLDEEWNNHRSLSENSMETLVEDDELLNDVPQLGHKESEDITIDGISIN